MILLFGEKAQNSQSTNKNTGIKHTNPVENSGILALNGESALSFLNAVEYDNFIASNPVTIDYASYSEWADSANQGFMSTFSDAVATISAGECGSFSDGGFAGACAGDGGCSCSGGGGGFSSVC